MITKIDEAKCTGCGICVENCPLDTIRLDPFREEIPPCQVACPAGVDIRAFIYLLSQGYLERAMKLVREALPLPAITGRVCFHPCESECARKEVDQAVNINSLERFLADYWLKEKAETTPRLHAAKVAVIGSGPAGLTCAHDLVRMGYSVTVFEAMPDPGGLLRYGIPEYRLPKKVLDAEIDYVEDLGVEIKTKSPVKDVNQLFEAGYKAIFLAAGAGASQKLGIPGEKVKGVLDALNFLKKVNSGGKLSLGDRVVVIGGSNAAIDASRVALRLGAKEVTIVYRRSRVEMPAIATEVEEAEREGVKIRFLVAPIKIQNKDGNLSEIRCIRMKLGEPDVRGRRQPVRVRDSEFSIDADNVVIAIGQIVDKLQLPKQIELTNDNTVMVDPVTLETSLTGVFAGGDVVLGPSSVVEAIASGKRAAASIDRYLKGIDLKARREQEKSKVGNTPKEGMKEKARQMTPLLSVRQRSKNFREVKTGFSEEIATNEARRCMNCGSKAYIAYPEDCMTCFDCELMCPSGAVYVHPFKEVLPFTIKY